MYSESGFDCSFRQTNFFTSAQGSQHSFRRHFGREFAIIIIILRSYGVCGNKRINRYAHLSSPAVRAKCLMKEWVYFALIKELAVTSDFPCPIKILSASSGGGSVSAFFSIQMWAGNKELNRKGLWSNLYETPLHIQAHGRVLGNAK